MGNGPVFGCMFIQGSEFILSTITIPELHRFVNLTNLITEFDREDIVPKQKPKYAQQLAMGNEPGSVPVFSIENKKEEDSYDIVVTDTTSSRLYEEYKWNEERIHRLGVLIARFAKMSTDPSEHAVVGIYIRWM